MTDCLKILYLEDDEDFFELMQLSLEDLDNPDLFSLSWAQSFDAAQKMVAGELFDIMLVDNRLSARIEDPTGIEFIEWLNAHGVRTPTLLLTSQTDFGNDPLDVLEYGHVHFIAKSDLTGANTEAILKIALKQILRVLVVDGDPAFCQRIEDALTGHPFFGFRAESVTSLDAARQRLERGFPDVLLTDHGFGPENSMDLIEMTLDAAPGTSIVLLSNRNDIYEDELANRIIGRQKVTFVSKGELSPTALIHSIITSRCKPGREFVFGRL